MAPPMEGKVSVETPARLHFGFTDVDRNGMLTGSAGVAVDVPSLRFLLSPGEREGKEEAYGEGERGRYENEIIGLARRVLDALHNGGEGVEAENGPQENGKGCTLAASVSSRIPRHVGLGSGTQMALASGTAVLRMMGRTVPKDENGGDHVWTGLPEEVRWLAGFYGRGKRSMVGIGAFALGGFILHTGNGGEVVNMQIPGDWRFVIAVPRVEQRIYGPRERNKLSRMKGLSSREIAGLRDARENLLKGLEDGDARLFASAVKEMDLITGAAFSGVQGGIHTYPIIDRGLEAAENMGGLG
ncbi:MAG: hypothetical protein J7L61_04200, partial [Thermoplasmata archaeon]|nr:hypothetical protein [Thermoplasmata archaeon]